MNPKILSLLLLTILIQGCSPTTTKETAVEMIEKCYDGVVYISNSRAVNSSLSVKFNKDSTVSTKLINGVECR